MTAFDPKEPHYNASRGIKWYEWIFILYTLIGLMMFTVAVSNISIYHGFVAAGATVIYVVLILHSVSNHRRQ